MDHDQLDHLARAARVQEAAVRRGRRDWLRRQVAEEATLDGVLLDLAETGCDVVVRTRGGGAHPGRLHALGRDHLVIGGREPETFIRLEAVVSVASGPGVEPAAGDRPPATGRSLRSVLGDLSARRDRVTLRLDGGSPALAGVVLGVGLDLVTLRSGVGAAVTYVPVGAIDELVVT